MTPTEPHSQWFVELSFLGMFALRTNKVYHSVASCLSKLVIKSRCGLGLCILSKMLKSLFLTDLFISKTHSENSSFINYWFNWFSILKKNQHILPVGIQFSSVAQSCFTLCDPMNCSTPGLPVHHQLSEFTQTHVHRVGESCRALLLLPSIPPSIRVFSNVSTLRRRWPKYWSFSFSIIPSKEIPGLMSFRMDWLDLLAVQGTLKSLLQHHSSKASVLRCSAFFSPTLTSIHDYWKNYSLD